MKKLIFSLLLTTVLTTMVASQPQVARAEETQVRPTNTIKSGSATLKPRVKKSDYRVNLLRAYLNSYESPLADKAEVFVAEADKYNIDYRLLPAIAGVESWFGTQIPPNSYNGWGWGVYGDHVTYFESWEDGIHTISQELRERYMDQWGAKNIYQIGGFYASDPAWTNKVMHFIYDMEEFESKQRKGKLALNI